MATFVQEQLVPIHVAARRLGVSPATIRRYVRHGDLRAVRLPSGHLRFSVSDLEALLERGRSTPLLA